jgi:predicted phosphodiesterase
VDQPSGPAAQTDTTPQPTSPTPTSTSTQTDASSSSTTPKIKKRRKPRKVAASTAVETIDVGLSGQATPTSAPASPEVVAKPKAKIHKAKSQGAGGMAIISKKTGNSTSSDQSQNKQRSGSVIVKPAFSSMIKLGATSDTALFRHAWNVIDEYEEKRANAMDAELEKKVAERLSQIARRSARASAREQAFRIASVQLPPDYTGPRLPAKLTPDSIQTLMTAFKNRVHVHYKFMQQIFYAELVHLSQFGNTLQRISLPTGGKIIVVGDLHGQLQDLLTVLRKHNMPSDTNFYLFNGDFVDRGQYGIEVLSLIYAMRQVWPKSVFLNRGNHEHPSMNKRYKFEAQVTHAYDRKLYSIISQTFALLPFAALIDERVFVVHGGLTEFSDLSVKDIEEVYAVPCFPILNRLAF